MFTFYEHLGVVLAGSIGYALWPALRPKQAQDMPDLAQQVPCRINSTKGGRSNKVTVSVSIPCDERFEFTLRRGNAYDALAKFLHVIRDFKTGDQPFDSTVFVGSDEPGTEAWLATDAEARAQWVKLLTMQPEEHTRITQIVASGGILTLTALTKPDMFTKAPADIGQTVAAATTAALKTCCDRLQAYAQRGVDLAAFGDPYRVRIRSIKYWSVGFLIVSIGWLFIARFETPPVRMTADFYSDSLSYKLAGVISVGAGLIGIVCLLGSVRMHTVVLTLVALTAFGSFAYVPQMLDEINRGLDQSPAQSYSAEVESKHSQSGSRSGTHYYLRVVARNEASRNFDLEVDQDVYRSVGVGDRVAVEEHSGYLDRPWVSQLTRE